MEQGVLHVQFMESFSLSYGGKSLLLAQDSAAKSVRLLAILLLNADTGVTRDRLLSWLYGDEETNAANSLKALLFRLRKRLQGSGLPDCEYIEVRDGLYRFTDAIPIESDVGDIRRLYATAKASESAEERAELFTQITTLYRGEILPLMSTELWVVMENASLTDIVIDAAKQLCEYYNDQRDYERAYLLNRRMSEMMPFDDQWHIGRINCLISLGRYQQAMDEYDAVTAMLFDEMGVFPSERLMECARTISSNIILPVAAAGDVNQSLSEQQRSGAYYCSYPSFVDSYHVLKRIMERTGVEATLLLCTVVGSNEKALTEKHELVSAIQKLTLALSRTLRKSDMFTRYSTSQMLVMLWDCPQINAAINITRIETAFEEILGEKRNSVRATYAVLDGSAPPQAIEKIKPKQKWKPMK